MVFPNWARDIRLKFRSTVSGDEILLKHCPQCGNSRFNFQISIPKCTVHCWNCDYSNSIQGFLKWQSIEFDAEEIQLQRPSRLESVEVKIPDNKHLLYQDSRLAMVAKKFLYERKCTDKIIEDWNMRIGTGEDQNILHFDYSNYILVPLYGLNGLEYWVGARFYKGQGYKMPSGTKDKWVPKRRGSDCIVLVEGLFDAINIWKYTDFDILILQGQLLLEHQLEMLSKINYEKVFVCLDGEAIQNAMKLSKRLYKAGINSYLCVLPEDKDPDDVDFRIKEYLNNSIEFGKTTFNRLRMKFRES